MRVNKELKIKTHVKEELKMQFGVIEGRRKGRERRVRIGGRRGRRKR